jgi:hypothetical protein
MTHPTELRERHALIEAQQQAEMGDAEVIRRLMKDEGVNPDTFFASSDGFSPLAWPILTKNSA